MKSSQKTEKHWKLWVFCKTHWAQSPPNLFHIYHHRCKRKCIKETNNTECKLFYLNRCSTKWQRRTFICVFKIFSPESFKKSFLVHLNLNLAFRKATLVHVHKWQRSAKKTELFRIRNHINDVKNKWVLLWSAIYIYLYIYIYVHSIKKKTFSVDIINLRNVCPSINPCRVRRRPRRSIDWWWKKINSISFSTALVVKKDDEYQHKYMNKLRGTSFKENKKSQLHLLFFISNKFASLLCRNSSSMFWIHSQPQISICTDQGGDHNLSWTTDPAAPQLLPPWHWLWVSIYLACKVFCPFWPNCLFFNILVCLFCTASNTLA